MKQSVKYLKILANLSVAVFTLAVVFYVAPRVLVFFMPFVAGYLISWIANPLVRFLEKHLKIVRKHSSAIIIIGVLALVILIFYLVISLVVKEAVHFAGSLPEIYESLAGKFSVVGKNLQSILNRLPEDFQESFTGVTENLGGYLGTLVTEAGIPTFTAAGDFVKNVPSALIAVVMSILSAFFFTADRDKIGALIRAHMPGGVLERVLGVVKDLKRVVGGYFKAQLKIMAVVYIILVAGFWVLGVDYAVLVGFFVAFLDMLPFFGTGTVLGPWAIIELLNGNYRMAIGLIVLYAVTQVVRQVIQPKILGDSIGMNPLATLFFMFVGYKFGGVLGMIIAVPIGMIVINLYKEGIFDNQIRCVKELVHDFNEFRKL